MTHAPNQTPNRTWTTQDVAFLAHHIDTMSLAQLAEKFGTSQIAIRMTCQRNSITVPRLRTHRRWLMSELRFLKENWHWTVPKMAAHLNRTQYSVSKYRYYIIQQRKRKAA